MSKFIDLGGNLLINTATITHIEQKGAGVIIYFMGAQPPLPVSIAYPNLKTQILNLQ
jgi:hypothetical protein